MPRDLWLKGKKWTTMNVILEINKDNLARTIGFAGAYDTKANFVLTVILALTAYLIAELPTYVDAHAKTSDS